MPDRVCAIYVRGICGDVSSWGRHLFSPQQKGSGKRASRRQIRQTGRAIALGICILLVVGCAKVSVHPLDANGYATGKPEGLRYYMPRPYLLVMRVPASSSSQAAVNMGNQNTNLGGPNSPPSRIGPPPAGATPPKSPTGTTPADGSTGPSTPTGQSPTTDTSYQAVSEQYVAKLIYLPDMSQPMAISESPGLFGTVTMGATLQDGWLLTSLQGNSDQQVAQTISAIASLAGAFVGGGAPKAAAAAKPPAPGAIPEQPSPAPPAPQLLSAGLYEFRYVNGALTGLCRLVAFEDPPSPALSILPSCSASP